MSITCPDAGSRASSAPAPPGSSMAVATVTAPSTPMEVCGRTGMNVRVPIVPPSRGALTRVVLGTDRPEASPSPISFPAASRSAWTLPASSWFPASSWCDSAPVSPKSLARATTTGMPLSTQLTSTPLMTSRTRPVGSRLPVAEPAVPANRSRIGAAVPGTPAIAVSPAYRGTPAGVANVAVTTVCEFTMWMRVVVDSSPAPISPRSTANGPTPARMFPQFCRSVIVGSSTPSCRNR